VVCQKHVDNAISKTINLPKDYDAKALSKDMLLTIELLKGITVYRDGSKGESPLVPVSIEKAKRILGDLQEEASVKDCPSGACET